MWIRRGELPDWYEVAQQANQGSDWAVQELKRLGIHSSETAWIGTDFDVVIENDSSIEDLYSEIKQLIIRDQVALSPSDALFG
jgi:hypothetical protein